MIFRLWMNQIKKYNERYKKSNKIENKEIAIEDIINLDNQIHTALNYYYKKTSFKNELKEQIINFSFNK